MSVGYRALDGSDRFDGDAVDLEDLITEQPDEIVGRQAHAQLVDGDAVVPLQDVDGDHVPAHRADATGHGPERPGSVGEMEPDQVVEHWVRLRNHCVHTVSD